MMSIFAYAESPPTPLKKALFLLIKAGKHVKMHLALSSLHFIVIYADYLGFCIHIN